MSLATHYKINTDVAKGGALTANYGNGIYGRLARARESCASTLRRACR